MKSPDNFSLLQSLDSAFLYNRNLTKQGCLFARKTDTLFEYVRVLWWILYTVKLGYSNIGFCDTLSIASNIQWYALIPHKAYSFIPTLFLGPFDDVITKFYCISCWYYEFGNLKPSSPIDERLYLQRHVNRIFSRAIKLLHFSFLLQTFFWNYILLQFYLNLTASLLHGVPLFLLSQQAWTYSVQVGSLCYHRFSLSFRFSYTRILDYWNLHTCVRKRCLDALYLVNIYSESELCHSLSEIVGLRVPCLKQKHFYLFNVGTFCCGICKHSFSKHWYINEACCLTK
jgi:hypothetical protein